VRSSVDCSCTASCRICETTDYDVSMVVLLIEEDVCMYVCMVCVGMVRDVVCRVEGREGIAEPFSHGFKLWQY
jgi:hypothetical protein